MVTLKYVSFQTDKNIVLVLKDLKKNYIKA